MGNLPPSFEVAPHKVAPVIITNEDDDHTNALGSPNRETIVKLIKGQIMLNKAIALAFIAAGCFHGSARAETIDLMCKYTDPSGNYSIRITVDDAGVTEEMGKDDTLRYENEADKFGSYFKVTPSEILYGVRGERPNEKVTKSIDRRTGVFKETVGEFYRADGNCEKAPPNRF
jgi:hypothetical protein